MYATGGGKGGGKTCCYEMKSGSLTMDADERTYAKCLKLAEEWSRLDDAARARKARSISHWSPYDRVGVVNADP